MAVDVMHLSPGQSFVKMAFGGAKSISSEELTNRHSGFTDSSTLSTSPVGSDKSSVLSLDADSHSYTEQEMKAVEQLEASRRQLESEIDHLVSELSMMGKEDLTSSSECSQIIQDSEESQDKKMMRRGRKLFNSKPSEGVRFLYDKGLLNRTAEDVAIFLFVNQLDKGAIGDYLGEGKEFNIQVLQEFVRMHKFHSLDLVAALRAFLGSFQLPGEAQKIDRMMESFAQRYCECNPGMFSNTDACYILSFAIIMLNTSLHNPNVKHKPTVEQFISMNRDINDGKDLPVEMLRGYYDAIRHSPFQYHEGSDELSEVFFNPDHQGYLTKEGGKHKSWRKRWFILTDNCLYYFKSPSDKEPLGIIPLENLEVRECTDTRKNHCFEICLNEKIQRGTMIKACKTNADGKVVVGNHLHYRIQAANESEKEEWMKRIKASISRNPFFEKLQERRQRVSAKGTVGL